MGTDVDGELVELTRSECLGLFADGVIGRVIFTDHALPTVQPVNYLLDGEEIIFRTANGSKLAAATRNAVVAFQVDEFDTTARSGWTVLGVGEAYEVVDPARLAELADLQTGSVGTRARRTYPQHPADHYHRPPPHRRRRQ